MKLAIVVLMYVLTVSGESQEDIENEILQVRKDELQKFLITAWSALCALYPEYAIIDCLERAGSEPFAALTGLLDDTEMKENVITEPLKQPVKPFVLKILESKAGLMSKNKTIANLVSKPKTTTTTTKITTTRKPTVKPTSTSTPKTTTAQSLSSESEEEVRKLTMTSIVMTTQKKTTPPVMTSSSSTVVETTTSKTEESSSSTEQTTEEETPNTTASNIITTLSGQSEEEDTTTQKTGTSLPLTSRRPKTKKARKQKSQAREKELQTPMIKKISINPFSLLSTTAKTFVTTSTEMIPLTTQETTTEEPTTATKMLLTTEATTVAETAPSVVVSTYDASLRLNATKVNPMRLPLKKGKHQAIVTEHGVYQCPATIIGVKHLVSSARCFIKLLPTFRADSNNYTDWKVELGQSKRKGPLVFDVNRVVPHPDFTISKGFANDLAVIELQSNIPMNDNIEVIGIYDRKVKTLETVTIIPRLLEKGTEHRPAWSVKMRQLSFAECSVKLPNEANQLTDNMDCAFNDVSRCINEEGQAVIYRSSLLAITTSIGSQDNVATCYPVVYTNLKSYKPWITSVITSRNYI